ncbi:MAG: amidohydrolase family protein [Desulfarculaceae bacterium]|nr:amidohydrolase family protein [Desulfarculaceae bacterium]MCF8073943.1 amidohydrolase family protein [Desulfarculaceae bacterium]MCF8102629.1 amidohydrolase family protein [Desulfarculaceae bacterium]MCF8117602.1 amidohydrolase family protein [Desulfarculaceae bacterium]
MLVDAHTHAFLAEDLAVLGERLAMLDEELGSSDPNKWQIHRGGTVDALVSSMERSGTDRCVLLPVTGSKGRIGELNRWAAATAAEHPQVIPFGTLHPSAEPRRQMAQLLELGLKGVKLHPFIQRIDLDQPEVAAMFRLLAGERLPVLLDTIHLEGLFEAKPHLRDVLKFFGFMGCQPHQIAALARANPDLPIIAAHMGSLYGWPHLGELLALDNVYFDLAYVNGLLEPDAVMEIIRQKGPERVIYGTDAPWREPAAFREWFEDLPLSSGEREMIAAGTLLEMLGQA